MKRRDLLKALATLPLLATAIFGKNFSAGRKIIKPKRLNKGDTVGLIAPAGYVDDEELQKAVKNIEDLGFKPKTGKNTRQRYNFLPERIKSVWKICIGRLAIRKSKPFGAFAAVME